MVSAETITGLIVALLLSVGAPVAVYLVCRHRMTLSWRNIVLGAGVFLLFALVLEQMLHYFVLQANPTTSFWIRNNPWGYVAYGVMAAALFEEIGRYLGMRLLAKPTGEPGTGVAYGIGHGGVEALLIGALPQFQLLMMAFMFNQGRLDAVMGQSVPAATLGVIKQNLMSFTFFDPVYGGLERVIALLLQIAFSLMVWKAVSQKKVVWLFAAIAIHAAFDIPAGMYQAGLMSMPMVQILMIGAGVVVLAFFLKRLPKRTTAAVAPAGAV